MNPIQLEALIRNACERAVSGAPVEDDHVELKSEWSDDFPRVARRIAAHANAALGAPVLWIIGVDEKARSITGAEAVDLAKWWPQVCAEFDDGAPLLRHRAVTIGDKTVTGLLFEPGGGPYVVRVKKSPGNDIDREIPWRTGTGVRSARRADLVKMLAPLVQAPEVEIRDCEVSYHYARRSVLVLPTSVGLHATMRLYITPRDAERVVFPLHRMEFRALFDGTEVCFDNLSCSMSKKALGQGTDTELVILGPSQVEVLGSAEVPCPRGPRGEVHLTLLSTPGSHVSTLSAPVAQVAGEEATWSTKGTI